MRKSNSNAAIIVGVLVVAVLAAFALRPGSTESEVLPPVDLPDPTDEADAAVILSVREEGGFPIFGLRFGSVERIVTVQFYASPGCADLVGRGDAWPTGVDGCSGTVPIEGVVSGRGIAATAESIVSVDVVVSRECFDASVRGEPWPPADPACVG